MNCDARMCDKLRVIVSWHIMCLAIKDVGLRVVCFVGRCLSLADLEMEDIAIPMASRCVPGQQGVKQPIEWGLQHFGPPHTVNNKQPANGRRMQAAPPFSSEPHSSSDRTKAPQSAVPGQTASFTVRQDALQISGRGPVLRSPRPIAALLPHYLERAELISANIRWMESPMS